MATPNVAGTATEVRIYPLSGAVGTATGTNATLVVSNGSASNALVEITNLTANNIDGTNACDVSVLRFVGTNSTQLYTTITVPADASLRMADNSGKIAVAEGESIRIVASAAGDLTFDGQYIEYK